MFISDSLAGKVVWIWGATSGLGEALAVELAKRGCKLVLSGFRGKELKEIRDKCLGNSYIAITYSIQHLIIMAPITTAADDMS